MYSFSGAAMISCFFVRILINVHSSSPMYSGINAEYMGKRGFTGEHLTPEYRREAKFVVWQLLNGLAYVHAWGVAHRDIKPANVLWSFNNNVKISDFGLAKFFTRETNPTAVPSNNNTHTGEVQTQWYRAPEILLGCESYTANVDEWSVGCIMAELFNVQFVRHNNQTGSWKAPAIFHSDNAMETFVLILELIGTPEKDTEDYKALSR
eukprot:Selendium_serpulae@DN6197_c0_g1_i5.p2